MSDSYDQLQQWYLARLRKSAIEEIARHPLTPMSLVQFDSTVVEKLLETSGATKIADPGPSKDFRKEQRLLDVTLLVVALVEFLILVLWVTISLAVTNTHTNLSSALIVAGAVVGLVGCTAAARFVHVTIPRQAQTIFARTEGEPAATSAGKLLACNVMERIEVLVAALARNARQSSERERAIADYASQIYFSLDAKGCFTAESRSCHKVFAATGDQEAKLLIDLIFRDDLKRLLDAMERSKHQRQPVELELRAHSSDSRLVFLALTVEWSDKEGRYFCVGEDISVKKKLEQLKTEFMNMITHDLKAPLCNIASSAQMLQCEMLGQVSDGSKDQLGAIEDSAMWLINLVNQLLDMEKLDEGKLPVNSQVISMEAVAESAIEATGALASEKNLRIARHIGGGSIYADETRLVQVLVNLLSNAIRYSPPGGTIDLLASVVDGQAQFAISDQGGGIPECDHEKVFDRFQQLAGQGGSMPTGGSGLGLSICKAIVEAHGGTIGLRNNEGAGATFWFHIPGYIEEKEAAGTFLPS